MDVGALGGAKKMTTATNVVGWSNQGNPGLEAQYTMVC